MGRLGPGQRGLTRRCRQPWQRHEAANSLEPRVFLVPFSQDFLLKHPPRWNAARRLS